MNIIRGLGARGYDVIKGWTRGRRGATGSRGRRRRGVPSGRGERERVVDKWRRRPTGWRKRNEAANYHSGRRSGGIEGNNLIPMSSGGGGGGGGNGLHALLHCPEPVVLSLADSVCR